MAEYQMEVEWSRDGAAFSDNRYSRRHRWLFDGGAEVIVSSSPHVVPVPMSDPAGVDPEEAFVASLSSCHMLWFLWAARERGFVADSYGDNPIGVLGKDESGNIAMTRVTLRPEVRWSGAKVPTQVELVSMHEDAHARCFIANSVKTDVRCEPVVPVWRGEPRRG